LYKVTIKTSQGGTVTAYAEENENLLSFLRNQEYAIPSPCGGKGVCGKCKVKITAGEEVLSAPYMNTRAISQEEWEQGYRLSCRIKITEDLTLELQEKQDVQAEILTTGQYNVALDPSLKKQFVKLIPPSIHDQTSDAERLEAALAPAVISDPSLLYSLPDILRESDYKVTATTFHNDIIRVESGNHEADFYGIAIDIGTTTVVGVLINLATGKEECVYSVLNPQKAHGDDVISRIDYTIENTDGLTKLKELMRTEISKMLVYFTEKTGVRASSIYHIVAVGNTVMMHLFAGIPAKHIAVSPFIPVIARSFTIDADEMSIPIYPKGKITMVPMVAGYVGADTIAAVLASGMAESSEISLLIDIGTNGEMALGNKDRIITCSTAAGPAFEGGHIRFGLGGVSGAINNVQVNEHGVSITTIGNKPARGICGSGVVDAAAQMLRQKLLEPYGRMISKDEAVEIAPGLADRFEEFDGKQAFRIASKSEGAAQDIVITQKDIREIQLAKGAIAAGIHILMDEMGIGVDDIDNVYLAGGFGNYIDYDHAVDIGLIRRELRQKVVPIGNGALTGAKMMLLSKSSMAAAEKLNSIMEYIELSSRLDFQTLFVDYMEFS